MTIMEYLEAKFEDLLSSERFSEAEREEVSDIMWGMVNYMR